jgi:hypothetical protein
MSHTPRQIQLTSIYLNIELIHQCFSLKVASLLQNCQLKLYWHTQCLYTPCVLSIPPISPTVICTPNNTWRGMRTVCGVNQVMFYPLIQTYSRTASFAGYRIAFLLIRRKITVETSAHRDVGLTPAQSHTITRAPARLSRRPSHVSRHCERNSTNCCTAGRSSWSLPATNADFI